MGASGGEGRDRIHTGFVVRTISVQLLGQRPRTSSVPSQQSHTLSKALLRRRGVKLGALFKINHWIHEWHGHPRRHDTTRQFQMTRTASWGCTCPRSPCSGSRTAPAARRRPSPARPPRSPGSRSSRHSPAGRSGLVGWDDALVRAWIGFQRILWVVTPAPYIPCRS